MGFTNGIKIEIIGTQSLFINQKLELIDRFEVCNIIDFKTYKIKDNKTGIIYESLIIKNSKFIYRNFDEMKLLINNVIRKEKIAKLLEI